MADTSALRKTSRARGVHDTVQVFRLGWVGLNGALFAHLTKFFQSDNRQVRVICLELLDLASLGKDGSVVDDDDLN